MKKILLFLVVSQLAFAQAPSGYYSSTNGLSGAPLKTALSSIITSGHQDKGYSGLWTAYQTTDIDKNYENDGSILDIYSERPTASDPYNYTPGSNQCGTYSTEGNCYNREHIVPQSLFNEASPMKNDIHFIRATDGKVNGMRSNYPFGKVGSASFTSQNGSKVGSSTSSGFSGTVFEPIDEFKGDVARMVFYFVTRYQNQLSGFSSGSMLGSSAFPGLQTWELNVLLAWHNQDPVSQAEINRNNASYTFQGNRNPFIDNPNYVNQIWGSQTPTQDTQAPTVVTNLAIPSKTANSISLTWNASTDNVAVTSYDVYMNGSLKTNVNSTSTTVTGLNPSTTYSFYVKAKDAAGNASANSSTVSTTTNAGTTNPTNCINETFETIPSSSASSYSTRTWTNGGITWTATDSRTDQTITNKAITVRSGSLKSSSFSNGINSLTVTTQLKFSGSNGSFNVLVNGTNVGTVPYSTTATTTTINNINVSGNVIVTLVNNSSSNRVAIDNLSWTCSGGSAKQSLSLVKNDESAELQISPNPISNQEITIKGNTENIKKAEIYNLQGKLMQTIVSPFKNGKTINIKNLQQGIYILKLDNSDLKFLVK
ncbi:Extracellular ribonuclease [Chryseobacterium aquaeductus]|uniref:Extracellular ribonuclease n=1 Tax=Chryseobacterium aquaeductus TaxID=2675056 RepID=A0A9N8MDU4_9FLAO|nr:endonuclease [Chryseobacterium aquaeductus]CAA7329655.1 Extracellular ribonuclease [Chryseobacterium potabilaquae]CAD7798186.1 Extracellular ribonuclease [Chryseobacterium aquaeductus]